MAREVNLDLQLSRAELGLTQQELGRRIGVTRQTIASWEKGVSTPTLGQLLDLAHALGTEVQSLIGQTEPNESPLMFRSDHPAVLAAALRSKLTWQVSNYTTVERLLGWVPALPESRPLDGFDPDAVEDVSKSIRQWLGVKDGPLCDILTRLEDKGIKVFVWCLPAEVSGFSAYTEESGAVIVVNQKHPAERRAFTALHELAHLIFHRREYQEPLEKLGQNDPREKVAQRFAGAMLLPEEVAARELRAFRGRWIPEAILWYVKERYCVSMRTTLLRAFELKFISRDKLGRQIGALNKKYGKMGEPLYPYALLAPTRLKRLVFEALVQEKVTTSRAAEILEAPVADIQRELQELMEGETS